MVWKSKATAASAFVADQVFETAELMETILLFVKPQDVLRAMQVNRAMRDTVNGSSRLLKAIGFLPDWKADFTPTFWQHRDGETEDTFHGIKFSDYDKRYCRSYDSRFDYIRRGLVPDPRLLTTADFILSTGPSSSTTLSKLGSRWKALSPCQPPIQKMEVRYH